MSADDSQVCKVDRVCEKWGLDDVDAKLRDRQQNSDASLRDLETYFNQRVLEAAMRDARAEIIEGEVENTYYLLTADDVSSGSKIEVNDRLRRSGVDPEAVTSDFVSYQTIRTHLQECLGVDTSYEPNVTTSDAKNTVFKLLSRTEVITERTINRLRSAGHVAISDVDVTLSLRIACTKCGEEYTFSRLLERGRCNCANDTEK
ncbi:rod-determining factor RdfA [Natrinema sp. SYSU A 869]|uniref:rod-determining factor RdfA n=1 Tax=Natrinema sp. SYSU A 869 TaxID=2871694 RepID=UPI001CA3BEFD|nr:rod-determining factor RdfA [Natrinema sp. SYSU A 869]